MKKITCFALGLALTISTLAQHLPVKRLNGSTIAADSLTNLISKIVDTGRIMGLSVLIINDNKVVYENYFGYRNKELNLPLTSETVSYAASLTKPLFSYLFLKLVDEGIFHLDKPLYTYLKKPIGEYERWADLAAQEEEFKKITPRMILSHTSGLPILRFLEKDEKLKIVSPPGKLMHYSNEGMNLLGFVVEEYTGKNLDTLCKEYVFDKLDMKNTGMVWHPEFDRNFAMGYNAKGEIIGAQKRTSARAAGSMVTSLPDYGKFVLNTLLKKGLSEKLYNEWLSPQIKVVSKRLAGPLRYSYYKAGKKTGNYWGLGWALHDSPYGRAFRHGGHADGWQNCCIAYPKKGIAIIILSNSDNFERNAAKILDLCIGDKYAPLLWMGYLD